MLYLCTYHFVNLCRLHIVIQKKILVVFFFEDDDIFPRASSSHHGYWNFPFKAPFSTLYFVFAVEEFFCRFFQQCQMISGVIWSGFSRLFLQPFATLYFTVHSLKPNYSSIIE